MKMSFIKKALLIDLIFFITLLGDQYIKYLFNKNPGMQGFIFNFDNFEFILKFSQNYNLAFGIPAPKIFILILVIAVIGLLIYLLVKNFLIENIFYITVLLLIIYGAISNLLDRIFYGYVIDYIDIRVWFFDWPIFNIADIMIVSGIVAWFIYDYFIFKKPVNVSN